MSDRRETLINISNGLIQTGALYELCETDSMRRILLFLVSISINGEMPHDPFDIYNRYYKNGWIAATAKYETIMRKCHLTHRLTFMSNLRRLEKKGFIVRERVGHRAYSTYSQNAYILGKVYSYGDDKKMWKQLFLMDAFYKMYPDKMPNND